MSEHYLQVVQKTQLKLPTRSHPYIEELAEALEVELDRNPKAHNWSIKYDGKGLRIERIADKLDEWPPVVARFQDRIREYLAQSEDE